MSYIKLFTISDFEQAMHADASLVYFSNDACSVCHSLKPKLAESLAEDFPRLERFEVNTKDSPELAAQLSVFTVPTVLVFFQGQEYVRKSRSFSIVALEQELSRPYQLLFD